MRVALQSKPILLLPGQMTEYGRQKTEKRSRAATPQSVLSPLSSVLWQPVMSDDHSELAPLLPIPNRTVKRLRADDSVHTYVKVGHRQTPYKTKRPSRIWWGVLLSKQRRLEITDQKVF